MVRRLSRALPWSVFRLRSGLYSDYDLANLQLSHFSNGRLQGFLDESDAVQAEAQRVAKCPRHTQDLLLAADTRVMSLYTDGSHSKPDDKCGLPDLAGWGFLALERTTAVTLHEQYDRVHCDIADPAYHGAPSKPPAAWTRLPGWEDLWNRPSPAPSNLDNDFLPGDGSLLTNLPARRSSPHKTRLHAYDGDAKSDNAPRRLWSRPVSSPVRPRRRIRDSALVPRILKKRRLRAVCPDAVEPAGPPRREQLRSL